MGRSISFRPTALLTIGDLPVETPLDLTAVRDRAAAYANFVDLRAAHTGTSVDPHVVTERAVAHYARLSAADVPTLLAVLDEIRAAAPDPALLRWCTWPDCWQHFNAVTGPAGDRKWVWACRQHALLCPKHRGAGHTPDFDYDSTLRTTTAHCECGDGEVISPGSIQNVLTWWEQHIREDVTSHTSTGT